MKKRYIIVFLITAIIIGLTNPFWLCKKLVDVEFNLVGNQEVGITTSFGSKDSHKVVNLEENNSLIFQINEKGHFNLITITIEQPRKNEKLIFSDLRVKHGKLKADDLSKFTITGANHKIVNIELVLTPTDDTVVLYYPISGSPSTTFQFDIFLSILILSILLSFKLSNYLADFKTIKNASRIDITFLTVFFVILFIPMSHLNSDKVSKNENRTLAKMPLFTKIDGRINYNYGKEYEEYFNDRFALRNEIISLNHFLVYNIQKIPKMKDFYVNKKNHFIFKDNKINSYLKKYSNEELNTIKNNLLSINEIANKNGKDFYILLMPAEESLYQDYNILLKRDNVLKEKKLHQICNLSKENLKLNIICMEDDFINYRKTNDKEFLYYKTDHHMTDTAAYITYLKFIKELNKKYDIKTTSEKEFNISTKTLLRYEENRKYDEGHSYKTANLNDKSLLDTSYKYYDYKYLDKIKIEGSFPHITHYNPDGKYNLLIIGNSFQENLSYFLNTSFKNIDKYRFNSGEYPLRKEIYEPIIKKSDADIVIFISHSPSLDELLKYNNKESD